MLDGVRSVGHGHTVPRNTAKVAISLDAALLEGVSRVQRATGESRSAVLARAVRLLLRQDAHRARVAEYVATYRRAPEDADEIAAARTLARRSLSRVAWDDE